MKHLTIRYDDLTLFDGDIEELVFTDNDQGITVQGRLKRAAAPGLGAKTLLDALTAASKTKTQQVIQEKQESSDG